MGWEKIFDILNWAKDKLPIPNRLEAIKNQIVQLEKERQDLLNGKATDKSAKRVIWINDRLDLLNKRLQNATGSA
jgi:conjugal transfer/entry exclusion protein